METIPDNVILNMDATDMAEKIATRKISSLQATNIYISDSTAKIGYFTP